MGRLSKASRFDPPPDPWGLVQWLVVPGQLAKGIPAPVAPEVQKSHNQASISPPPPQVGSACLPRHSRASRDRVGQIHPVHHPFTFSTIDIAFSFRCFIWLGVRRAGEMKIRSDGMKYIFFEKKHVKYK